MNNITKNLSKNLNTEVSIDKVQLNIFRGLELKGLYVADPSGGALLEGATVSSTFRDNILSLLNKRLFIKSLHVKDIRLNIYKAKQEEKSNLQVLIDRYNASKNKPMDDGGQARSEEAKKSFLMEIQNISLENIDITQTDMVKGQTISYSLGKGKVLIENLNLKDKIIELKEMLVFNPQIKVSIFEDSYETTTEGFAEQQELVEEIISSVSRDSFSIYCAMVKVENGQFILDNSRSTAKDSLLAGIDYNHLRLKDISMEGDSLILNESILFQLSNLKASLATEDGFKVPVFTGDQLLFSKRKIELTNALIKTQKSVIKDQLSFKFKDISDLGEFVDKVILDLRVNQSTLSVEDLVYLVPVLQNNDFFSQNKNDFIRLNGRVTGRVNNLSGRNIDLNLGRKVIIAGNFNSRNLTDRDEAIVNMGFSKLNAQVSVLSQLISGFAPPANFYKLGTINFKGRFDGYFQDFVAFGDLASDLGNANLDMRMDLKAGKARAAYSGQLDLERFNLAGWTGNSDFGTIDLSSSVEDGVGLTLETVSANLGANVHSFYFKGYHYEDFSMDGKLQKNLFDGKFEIEDPNIDLNFTGSVDFIDSIPAFSFDADIRSLNLNALNLTSQDYQLSGLLNVDMKGAELDIISGTAIGKDISLSNGAFKQDLDSIHLKSDQLSLIKSIQFYSDLMQGNLLGDFEISSLPDAFIHVLKVNYPKYSAGLNYFSEDTFRVASNFDFDVLVVDSENLFSLLMNNSFRIKSLLAKGTINDAKNLLVGSFEAPEIIFKDYRFLNIKSRLFSEENNGTFNLRLDSIIQGKNKIDPVQLISRTSGDSLLFDIQARHLYDISQNIYLSGILFNEEENFVLNLKDSHFEMLNETWDIKFESPVLFRKNFIDLQDVSITDGSMELKFNDVNNKGLNCVFVNIPFTIVNDFAPVKNLSFGGFADGMMEIDDVFNGKELSALLLSKDFTVNGDSYGELRIRASSNDLDSYFSYNGKLVLEDQTATLSGQYLVNQKITEGSVLVNKYPVSILEYFLGDGGISNTIGNVSGEIDYSGPVSDLDVSGFAKTDGVETHVDYLGVSYSVIDGQFQIKKDLLDFTGMQLQDIEGNLAVLDGGLTHQGFKNLALDLSIQAPRFTALNTTKEDNPSFYGYGAGKINVDFSGPFDQVFINVDATTGRSSILSIPVESSEEEVNQSFIQFINKEDIGKIDEKEQVSELSSLNLNMNLEITDQAQVIIIFDENANDILRSRGRGGIQLEINPQGEFIMFGNYQVESGQYLFTLPFVNKPFSLNNGGTIIWTGDPLNAQLAVDAEYQDLRAPLDIFLAEYLTDGTAVEAAAQRETEVQLTMKLSGTLLSPTINFDLAFPNVSGNLKSFTDSKLRTLKADESALYDQVFSLIVFQTFLPETNPLQIGYDQISETTYNTFSEFASSQISILLTSLLEEAIIDNKYWSDIDFQLGLSKNNGLFASENSLLPDEVNLHIINKFNNDKWSFNIGGDYKEDPIKNQAYLTGDFILEYFLTDDRRLKLRMYGKLDYDELNFQRKQKVGLGINYRREFNSLFDWRKSNNKDG